MTGPAYREMVQGKDLVADILPPPEYVDTGETAELFFCSFCCILRLLIDCGFPVTDRLIMVFNNRIHSGIGITEDMADNPDDCRQAALEFVTACIIGRLISRPS